MMLKLMQINPALTRPRNTIDLPMLPARKRIYTIGELVLCNCTERAEGDKMGGGAREEKIGCGQKQLLVSRV
jgi:hypothetical protein